MAWLGTWAKRFKLTIDSSKIDTANLTNFPLMVKLSSASGISDVDVSMVFDELISDTNRKKIAITSSDGTTQCYVEIEEWDDANEIAWLHVKVPTVAYNADTILYLYYDLAQSDNTTYVGDTGDSVAENVWDSDFLMVYHLNQDPDGDANKCIISSAYYPNINDDRFLTPIGSMTSDNLVDVKVGKGLTFDGIDDTVYFESYNQIISDWPFTIESICKNSTHGSLYGMVSFGYATNTSNFIKTAINSSNNIYGYISRSEESLSLIGPTIIDDDDLVYSAFVCESSIKSLYLNGEPEADDTSSIALPAQNKFAIGGAYYKYHNYYPGIIDEVRVSKVARSASWIKATYNSLWDSLITFDSDIRLINESVVISDTISVQLSYNTFSYLTESMIFGDYITASVIYGVPTRTVDDSLWWKGKRPLVREYIKNAADVANVTARRGHLYRPGFLGALISDAETGLKFKLSDLNYEITKQMVERELVQTGHDYDITIKEAQIAWELEKTATLTALEQEFADNKYMRELSDLELDRLEITINLRKLVIMAAKTAIDIEMQELRQEMTDVDRSTFHAEDALLNAKLVTARKKLEVIPYIETVLEKQQLIIDAESNNADRKSSLITQKELLNDARVDLIAARELIADTVIDLISAKQAVVTKKQSLISARELVSNQESTNIGYLNNYIQALSGLSDVQQDLIAAKKALIPKINEKSAALISYAAELDAWIIVKQTIANVKEEISNELEIRQDLKGDIVDAESDLNVLKLELQEAKINLEIAQLTGKSNLLTQKISNAAKLLSERESAFDSKINTESNLVSKQIALEQYISQSEYETMQDVNDILIPSQLAAIRAEGGYRITTKRTLGDIAANAKLTSGLVHLLT